MLSTRNGVEQLEVGIYSGFIFLYISIKFAECCSLFLTFNNHFFYLRFLLMERK